MINNITIQPIAIKEIEEAWHWYESRRNGLGDDFILCVEETLEKISYNPKLYPIVHKKIRRAIIHRFPFSVLYFIESNKIIIIGVFQGNRNPKSWKNRI